MVAELEAKRSLTKHVILIAVSLTGPLTIGDIIKGETKGCLVLTLNDNV